MIPLSLKKIAAITNGQLHGKNLTIHEIVIDTKKIISGCLFVALKGKKFDAHIFIKKAIDKGCSAIISEKKIKYNISYIIVQNTSIALGSIACWIRKKINPKILAITGSCGKTSVKEMTNSILKKNKNTISTIDNLNNHIGVPITLIRLEKKHKYGIIELGANHPGEIYYSSNVAKPNVVLINNIYYSHLEGFKSLLGVSKAKSEILCGLQSNGTVIINLDSHHTSQWKKKIKNKNILYFSIKKKKESNFFSSNIKIYTDKTCFTMYTPSGKINISLPCLGYQNISNALAATALAFSLNIPLKQIQNGLLNTPLLPGRLESIRLSFNKILINDTYNSNVASMIAAIKVLENMPGYKVLVTSDMAELGENSILYHKIIGNIARLSKINSVLSIGKNSYEISKVCQNGIHFSEKETLKKNLTEIILKKDKITILIKGSRRTKMETVIEYLTKEFKENVNLG